MTIQFRNRNQQKSKSAYPFWSPVGIFLACEKGVVAVDGGGGEIREEEEEEEDWDRELGNGIANEGSGD